MTSMMTQDQKEEKRKRGGKAQEIVNVSRAIGKFFFLFFKKKTNSNMTTEIRTTIKRTTEDDGRS